MKSVSQVVQFSHLLQGRRLVKVILIAWAPVVSVLLAAWLSANAQVAPEQVVFRGPWHTTNRKLDGVMTCVVTKIAEQEWRGRFSGTWNGVSFDHSVAFKGPPEALRGAAV